MRKLTDILLIAAIVIVVLFAVNRCTGVFDGVTGWFRPQTGISQVTIEDIRKIGQLKVLTVNKEFLVSQYRKRGFLISDDEIHIVYDGRIDLGFDLSDCRDSCIVRRSDSTFVTLPAVQVLNQNSVYVDPGDVKIEDGKWTNSEMEGFKKRANAYMLYSSERDDCYHRAERMGMQTITNLLRPLETSYIEVRVEGRESYGMSPSDDGKQKQISQQNPYRYVIDDDKTYLEYLNGSVLFYDGVADYDLIAVADLFNVYMDGKKMKVTLRQEKKKKSNSYIGFDSPFSKQSGSKGRLAQFEKTIKQNVNKYLSVRSAD